MKTIQIQYYALLREERGIQSETHATESDTAFQLYAELSAKHKFSLTCNQLTLAINEEFKPWDSTITSGDSVVFIPPVAGG